MASIIVANRHKSETGLAARARTDAEIDRQIELLSGHGQIELAEDEADRMAAAEKLCQNCQSRSYTELAIPMQLHELPEILYKLKKLKHLDLGNNKFSYLPKALFNLDKLEVLVLDSNRLIAIPSEIGRLKKLVRLSARENYLEELDPALCKLPRLQKLDVGRNHLGSLPTEIGALARSLVDLRIDGNRIESLPDSLCELKGLAKLEAQHNQIERLPLNIHHMKDLLWLGLAYNNIVELPPGLGTMEGLLNIDLSVNPVDSPPPIVCNDGASAIRHFLTDVAGSETKLSHWTIVMVGRAGDAQSTLAEKLSRDDDGFADNDFPRYIWKPQGDLEVSVWDCPADEVFVGTHQMLLFKPHCLFSVVVDMQAYSQSGHEEHVGKWVRMITSRVRSAKILLLGTNTSTLSPKELEEKSALMQRLVVLEEDEQVEQIREEIARLGATGGKGTDALPIATE
eukprot:SAG31_NODE_7987_length_1546_cov_8.453495_1_plen_454_part_01